MERLFPVPTNNPLQEPEYQVSVVPDPPLAVRTIFPASSAQKLFLFEITDVGATGKSVIVTVVLSQVELPQKSSQDAKYVVVEAGVGIVNGLPVPTSVPPQASEYQFRVVPRPPIAVSVMFAKSPSQKLP
jgi:hypothetical protein